MVSGVDVVDLEGHDVVGQSSVESVVLDPEDDAVTHDAVENGDHGRQGVDAQGHPAQALGAQEVAAGGDVQVLMGAVVGEHPTSIGHRVPGPPGPKVTARVVSGQDFRPYWPDGSEPHSGGRGQSPTPVASASRRSVMKALVYHGPGKAAWEEVPDPEIVDATDAVVRVDCTTICGSDLHILKGDLPEVSDGRILGHEAVGTVETVGAGVTTVAPGDRVLVSCISACGRCRYCREGRFGQCLGGGGWILGHLIDGTQAEYVRVPFADNSLYPLPSGGRDEEILMVADILPTAYEVGVLNGKVATGRHGGRGRCRTDRAVGHHGQPALLPQPDHGHRPGRRPAWRRPRDSEPT